MLDHSISPEIRSYPPAGIADDGTRAADESDAESDAEPRSLWRSARSKPLSPRERGWGEGR